jgi:hypothetical protein
MGLYPWPLANIFMGKLNMTFFNKILLRPVFASLRFFPVHTLNFLNLFFFTLLLLNFSNQFGNKFGAKVLPRQSLHSTEGVLSCVVECNNGTLSNNTT